ncbi:MAG: CUB domain-containing protein [Patescibacteria group bacterium]
MKNKVFFGLAILIGILLPTIEVRAQVAGEDIPREQIQTKIIQLADVEIVDPKILKQKDNVVTLSWQLTNGDNVQPDVNYGVKLVKYIGTDKFLVDEYHYDHVLNMVAEEKIDLEAEYKAPAYLQGKYEIWINAFNSNSMTFGLARAGDIELNGNGKYVEIETQSCFLTLEGDENQTSYQPLQGLTVDSQEKLLAHCPTKNLLGKEAKIIGKIQLFYRSLAGEEIASDTKDDMLTLKIDEEREYVQLLPKPLDAKPQAYEAVLKFFDEQGQPVSNMVVFHFVLTGPSATIQNVTLDKDGYKKGDIAQVTAYWTGAADDYLNSRLKEGGTLNELQMILELKNAEGQSCTEIKKEVWPINTDKQKVISLPIDRECTRPNVILSLADSDSGKILDEKKYDIVTRQDNNRNNLILILTILLIIVGLILVIWFRKRVKGIHLWVGLFLGVGALFFSNKVYAKTFLVEATWGATTIGRIEYTVSLDKATYVQDDPMTYSISVKDANCLNHSAQSDFLVWIDDAFVADGDHGQTDPQNQAESLTLGDTTLNNPPSNFDDSFSSIGFIASHAPNDLSNPYHFLQSRLDVSINYAPDPGNLHDFGPYFSYSSGFDIPYVIKSDPTPPAPPQTLTDPITYLDKDVTVNNPQPEFPLENYTLRYEKRCDSGNPIVDLHWEKFDQATQYYLVRNNNPITSMWTNYSYDLGDGGFIEGAKMEVRGDYIKYTQGLTYQDQINPCAATCFGNAACVNDSNWDGVIDTTPYYSIRDLDNDSTADINDVDFGYASLPDIDNDLDNDGLTNDVDPDIDNDGISNDLDPDDDNDSVLDIYDVDWDNDQIVNLLDPDSGGGQSDLDNDLDDDGLTNDVDPDIDNDGTSNQGGNDWDEDGIENDIDVDDDGDGIADADEVDTDEDLDNDGLINDQDRDNDGDGILNSEDEDNDNDGWTNDLDPNSRGGNHSDCSAEYRVYAHVPIINYKMTVASETPTTVDYDLQLVFWPVTERFLSHYRFPSYSVGSANTVLVPMYCSTPGQPPVVEEINLTTSVDCSDYENPEVNLDWSVVSDIESTHIIKFDVDNYPPRNILAINPVTDTGLDDAAISNNNTYGYYVQIKKTSGEYLYSNERKVVVQCTPPAPDTLTIAGGCSQCSQGNAEVDLSWDWTAADLTLPVTAEWSLSNDIGTMTDWETDQTQITHPNYPDLYPENYDNTWTITYPGMRRLRVHFSILQLDWDDHLVIMDGSDQVITDYEDEFSGPMYSEEIPGDTVKIHFYSDPNSSGTYHWFIDAIESIDDPRWNSIGATTTGSAEWKFDRNWLDGKTIYFRAKICDTDNNCSTDYATAQQTFNCVLPNSLAVLPNPINVKNAGRSMPLMALVRCDNGEFMTDELGRELDLADSIDEANWVLDAGILAQRPELIVENYASDKSLVDNAFYGTFSETVDLSSPNYPANYNDNDLATITITKPGATFIRVNFDDFEVSAGDNVTIVSENDYGVSQYGVGYSAVARGNELKIKFNTNQSLNARGWHINEVQWSEGEENSIADATGILSVSYEGNSNMGIPPLTGTSDVNVIGQSFVLQGNTDCSEYDINQNPMTIFNLSWDSYPGADGYVVVDKTDTSDQRFYFVGNTSTYSERKSTTYNRTYQIWAIDINNADWIPIAVTNNAVVGIEPCSAFGEIEYSLDCANPSDPIVTLNFSTIHNSSATNFYLLKNGFDRAAMFYGNNSRNTYSDSAVETSYTRDIWQVQAENLTSPNYPANYPNNYSNTWTYTHPGATKMRLHFVDFIGPYRSPWTVDNDRVEILNGSDTIVQTIREGYYNGHIGPMTTNDVTGDTIKVRFISDNNNRQARGWKIDQLEYSESSESSNVYTYQIVPYLTYTSGNDAFWEKKLPESNTVSVTVDCDDKPNAPTNLSINATCPTCGVRDIQTTLDWDDVADAQNYSVDYSSRQFETDLTDVSSPGYPANITGTLKQYYTISKPGAVALQVHFSEIQMVWLERIYISNERDELKQVINGEDFPTGMDSVVVEGDTIKIYYEADGWDGEDRRFKIDSYNWFNYSSGTRYWQSLGTVNDSEMTFNHDLLDVNNNQVYYRVYSLKNGLRSDDYGEYNFNFNCSVPSALRVIPGNLTLDANGDTATFDVNASCSAGENLPSIDTYNNYLTRQLSPSLTTCSPGTNVSGFGITSGNNTTDCSGTLETEVENYFFDHYSWGPLSGSGDVEILGEDGPPTPPTEPTRFFEPNGKSQLTDNLSTSQVASEARHILKYKINNNSKITNGSIKINFAPAFDLSGLTAADVTVTGGDVVWGTPTFGSVIIPFTGELDNTDGEITITIGNTNFINNPGLTGSYPIILGSHDSNDGTGDPIDEANDEAQIFDNSLNDVLSDSIKTEDAKHTIHFNPGSIQPISNGSIKIILANEFDLTGVSGADILPTGGDVTWGSPTVNVLQKTIIIPFVGTFDHNDGLITIVLGNSDDRYINNPVEAGSYSIILSTHETSDGLGDYNEWHQAMVAITDAVTVTATIPSSLTFEILPVAIGTAVNGANTSIATEASIINFDRLTPAIPKIAAQQLRVSTNAAEGFSVTLQALDNFTSSGNQINFFDGTNNLPISWHSPSGVANGFFGYTTSDNNLGENIYDRFDGNKWAGAASTPKEVMYHDGPTNGTIEGQGLAYVGFQVEINELQAAGNYQTSLMYICTPTF